jgi:hypothetical protein
MAFSEWASAQEPVPTNKWLFDFNLTEEDMDLAMEFWQDVNEWRRLRRRKDLAKLIVGGEGNRE